MTQHDTPMTAGQSATSNAGLANSYLATLRHVSMVTLTLALCWLFASPVIYLIQGGAGVAVAGAAALVCVLASIVAAVVATIMTRRGNPLGATLLPMMVRMALPLAVCLVAESQQSGPLADHRLSLYLIGFYLIALAADTLLSLGRVKSLTAASKET